MKVLLAEDDAKLGKLIKYMLSLSLKAIGSVNTAAISIF